MDVIDGLRLDDKGLVEIQELVVKLLLHPYIKDNDPTKTKDFIQVFRKSVNGSRCQFMEKLFPEEFEEIFENQLLENQLCEGSL